ncbi:glycerophosphodiester phosphodiesterase family protein [Daejeonella lutea]|uniref:Glycerophosphoryl diester phosphodiesterase n=1 Tax=Daejeonella lutea TaxID=572036 RepID=A0A1T5BC11_9SPHI|nr:glycerophosphodiester phosphodiesterase family protein [Daejeonella lutea]SKB44530.1 glycerophosphoryl diester phosphodiesterase [Daejeonella lutea]
MRNIIIPLAFFTLASAGCKTRPTSTPVAFPSFSTEAHRGGRGLMPENTIPAMKNAIDLGVTTLEMDTHISADQKVMLSHDDFINPLFTLDPEGREIAKTDNKKYPLYTMTYAEIKKFDAGSKGNTGFPQQKKIKTYIPLLADVIDSVQNYIKSKGKQQVFYNIETKSKPAGDDKLHPAPEKFVDLLVKVLDQKKITPYSVIQSFDVRTLQVINRKYPHIKTSLLVDNDKTLNENIAILGFKPFIISPIARMVNQEFVSQAHQQNMKVIPWTVNTADEISRIKSLGVDGIISDYPNLLTK